MVSSTTKLVVMGALAAVAIVLSSAVFTLTMILNKRKSLLAQRKKLNKSKDPTSLQQTTSKTILPSTPPNATQYNLPYKNNAPFPHSTRSIANVEFAMALRNIPFENKGGYIEGNAYPVPEDLGEGAYKRQNERGAEFVMGSKKKKSKNTKTTSKNINTESSVNWFDLNQVKKYLDTILQNDEDNPSLATLLTTITSDILHKITSFTRERTAEDTYLTHTPSSRRKQNDNEDTLLIQKKKQSTQHKAALTSLHHLQKASQYGHSSAQNMIAITLATGVLPVDNHVHIRTNYNTTTELTVPSDFSQGGEQLARALTLWHYSAMDGNVEAAMALGYRHRFSALEGAKHGGTISSTSSSKQQQQQKHNPNDGTMVTNEMVQNALNAEKDINSHSSSSQHYGVLGTCESALTYYEAAANAILDTLEQSPHSRGKVNPSLDQHRLAEIYMNGGASSALSHNNKPDELEEALQYYRMRASRTAHPHPDVNAAYTLANFYHYGLRGARQDMKLALKYYEIAADFGSWEAAGQAGKFHVWSIGMEEEERDLKKAYRYFKMGTPGGLEGCRRRIEKKAKKDMKKKAKKKQKKNGRGSRSGAGGGGNDGKEDEAEEEEYKMPWEEEQDDDYYYDEEDEEEVGPLCDHPCANGMGLLHLFGVPMIVPVNVQKAKQWFALARDMGNMDANYNLGMMRLGWMAGSPVVDEKDKDEVMTWEEKVKKMIKENKEAEDYDEEEDYDEYDYDEYDDDDYDDDDYEDDDYDYDEEDTEKQNKAKHQPGKDFMQKVKEAERKFEQRKREREEKKKRNADTPSQKQSPNNSNNKAQIKTSVLAEPTKADFAVAIQEFTRAASKGHIQAKHRLGMMFAHGVETVHQRSHHPHDKNTQRMQQQKVVAVQKNCPLALRYYKDVVDSGTTIARRTRVAYKQYVNGNMEDSLRNYMAAAETGSEIGQVNAAFLLESGYCLGMNQEQCMKASLRYWRAAARQGNEEACLRVGDFYYYGRIQAGCGVANQDGLKGERDVGKDNKIGSIDLTPGPFTWMRYVLYPEELIPLIRVKTVQGVRWLLSATMSRGQLPSTSIPEPSCSAGNGAVCSAEEDKEQSSSSKPQDDGKDHNHDHLAIAADYYRLAAEEHGSSRANFNLGFMHEWGLGLTQDFPLAKRHYDLAASTKASEAEIAVQLALMSMNIHEKVVRFGQLWEEWRKQASDGGLWSVFFPSDVEHPEISSEKETFMEVLISEALSGETLLIVLLTFVLFGLIGYRQQR